MEAERNSEGDDADDADDGGDYERSKKGRKKEKSKRKKRWTWKGDTEGNRETNKYTETTKMKGIINNKLK